VSARTRQILVAGIGNAFMGDDGFGGRVAQRLEQGKLPDGVSVFDFGTGGLDLAYEVMRGYDALVIVDISRQGEEPGTVFVMEPDPEDVEGGIEDGAVIDPHAMDPQTVLRFVKSVGGWPGKVVIVACEPSEVGQVAWGLSEPVEAALDRAVEVVLRQVEALGGDAAYVKEH
jgi:hydrogenase maturation protease